MNEKKKKTNPAVTWSIRAVVFGVLIALLIVAWMEFSTKSRYQDDWNAVVDKWEANNRSMVLKEFESLTESADETEETKSEEKTIDGVKGQFKAKVKHYKGPFRTYKIWAWHQKDSQQITYPSGKDDGSQKDD